jgi:hypothetical protein
MGNAKTPGRSRWSGVAQSVRWLARAGALLAAGYIFFPPFWDAAFAANLQALHKAPYVAADRARHLWHRISDGVQGNSGAPEEKPGTANVRR